MATCEICGRPRGYERGQCACGLSFATSASVEECYQLGYEREKARADAADARASARELDMHEAQGLAWRLRREIRVFDSAQMTAMFGGAWREVETVASLIRDEWDPWDFGDEPTTDRPRLREVHDHLTAHGLPALDRLDAEDVP